MNRPSLLLIIAVILLIDIVMIVWSRKGRDAATQGRLKAAAFWLSRTVFVLLALIFVVEGTLVVGFLIAARSSPQDAVPRMTALIAHAGGADKVLDEARRMFAELSNDRLPILLKNRATEYPVLNSLGQLEVLSPSAGEFPAFIQIRVRSYFSVYHLLVFNPDERHLPPPSTHLVELSRGIYVSH